VTLIRPAAESAEGVQAVLFDTFGTVVDWRSGVSAAVHRVARTHGFQLDAEAFADSWRAKYEPSMDPVRRGTRPFTILAQLHRENLTATLAEFAVELTSSEVDDLNHAWEQLPPWPDSIEGLSLLKQRHIVGPLSNGNVGLLTRMAKQAGLPWDVIIGSDITRRYKPQPEAYLRAADLLELEPAQVMMAAAHNYDLAAARRAGLSTAFVPRPNEHGPAQTNDLRPEAEWDVVADDLIDLARQLGTGPD
jgi:2-haloacid dehalogenase